MKTSQRGINDLVFSEGLRTKAYRDSVGVWTIGVGHTASAGQPIPKSGMTITKQEALNILARDLAVFERAVDRALGPVPQNVFDGAVSFHFNTGAINRASWVGAYKSGLMAKARQNFMLWVKPPEITARRKREAALIFDGKYYSPAVAQPQVSDQPVIPDGPPPVVVPPPPDVPAPEPAQPAPEAGFLSRLLAFIASLFKKGN